MTDCVCDIREMRCGRRAKARPASVDDDDTGAPSARAKDPSRARSTSSNPPSPARNAGR